MTELEAFGERLSQERRRKSFQEKRDILKKDVAAAVGASESSVGRWESGLVWPDETSIAKLAAYYNVTKAWLRYGEETATGAPRMEQHQQVDPGSLLSSAGKVTRAARKKK